MRLPDAGVRRRDDDGRVVIEEVARLGRAVDREHTLLVGVEVYATACTALARKPWRRSSWDPATKLEAGDVVTALHLPLPPKGCAGVYLKLGRNQVSDLSIAGVTALGHPDSSCPSGYRFRLALASVAPVPFVPVEAERHLARHPNTPESLREAAQLAADACSPIDDVRGSARYRKLMVRNLSATALAQVWNRLTG